MRNQYNSTQKMACIFSFSIIFCFSFSSVVAQNQSMQELKQNFVNHRLGVMMHFNIGTFSDLEWSTGAEDPSIFNPVKLNCEQWAAACKSAGAKYAILTTKHHDGFCLWDSKTTTHDIGSSPLKRDVVREYVNAFRKHGLSPSFYFSIWDRNAKIDKGVMTPAKLQMILDQLTELLTNYGPIEMILIDGWCWKMGHHEIPYQTIREHIKKLQPRCLISDHTHVQSPWNVDLIYFEGPMGEFPPEGNIYASQVALTCTNGWFWHAESETKLTLSADQIVEKINLCQPRYCNFMINVSPNRHGLYDDNVVTMLKELGSKWSPDIQRPPLPKQPLGLDKPIHVKSVNADGNAHFLIDGMSGGADFNTTWVHNRFPAQLILDLGEVQWVGSLSYLPQQFPVKPNAIPKSMDPNEPGYIDVIKDLQDISGGRVLKYRVLAGMTKTKMKVIHKGSFDNSPDLKVISFKPFKARYIKFEILTTVGNKMIAIDDISVGR